VFTNKAVNLLASTIGNAELGTTQFHMSAWNPMEVIVVSDKY